MTCLSLIAAMAKNRIIGRDNQLPWKLPEDLRYFKAATLGKPVIMGRKTWESLGRPLPGRRNIVVTRNARYALAGAEVAPSLEAAITAVQEETEVFVIGGAELYRQALPIADRLYLTEIAEAFGGDASFPELSPDWQEISRETHVAESGLGYAFVVYQHNK